MCNDEWPHAHDLQEGLLIKKPFDQSISVLVQSKGVYREEYQFETVLFPFYWSVYFQWTDTYNMMK